MASTHSLEVNVKEKLMALKKKKTHTLEENQG